jgi:hypothetical protein
MKRIIQGITYDTETAISIARGDHDHPASSACWILYQTSQGAFFEVATGHGGEIEDFKPLTAAQARRFLEVNANHLVERYFGPTPEPRRMCFSRRTIIAGIEIMEGVVTTHADLTRRLLKWDKDLNTRCDAGNLADRFNHMIKFLDENPHYRLDDGSYLGEAVVEEAVTLLSRRQSVRPSPQDTSISTFRRALELDGFIVTDGSLRRAFPSDLGLPEAEDDVTRLLNQHGFTIPKGHLNQGLDAHGRGDWAAANAQLRSFFEGLLDEIAKKLDPSTESLPNSENRRAKLGAIRFLRPDLNEWSNDGKNFINGVWRRLQPEGSHPGLSDQEDSTFRRHIVLLTARFLLVRLDRRNQP